MQVYRLRQALIAAPGTQDWTFPAAPRLVLLHASYAVTDATSATHAVIAEGAYDGTTQLGISTRVEDGSTGPVNGLSTSGTNVLQMLGPTGGTAVYIASASFVGNALRLTVSATDGRQVFVEVLAFTGTDIPAVLVTAPSFSAGDLVDTITLGARAAWIHAFGRGTTAVASHSFGWYSDALNRQVSVAWNALGSGGILQRVDQGSIFRSIESGVERAVLSIENVTATTFDVRASEASGATVVALVALALPEPMAAWTGIISSPKALGTWEYDEPRMEPVVAGFATTRLQTQGELRSTSTGCLGSSRFLGGSDESWLGMQCVPGDPADTQSRASLAVCDQPEEDGSMTLAHTIVGATFFESGWRATVTNTDPDPSLWPGWAIGTPLPSSPAWGTFRSPQVKVVAESPKVEHTVRSPGVKIE